MIMLKLAVTLRVNLSGPRQRRYEYDMIRCMHSQFAPLVVAHLACRMGTWLESTRFTLAS